MSKLRQTCGTLLTPTTTHSSRSVDRHCRNSGRSSKPDAQGVETQQDAFMSASLPIAGFAVIEAADLADAIQLVSRSPCAVAHGVV